MSERCIIHVDMDAFYASVEQRDDPSLRGRPVLVGGTGRRGVVAAASYEARQFGVRSAMPMAEARDRCPDAVCVAPRMAAYQAVSRQVFEVFREFTPEVEGLSLDEAYLDVTGSLELFGPPGKVARAIKARIREVTSLTASTGIGPNKLVAKIASERNKPDGLCEVPRDAVQATLDPLPVRAIGGIGPRTGERLAGAGIHTIGELRQAPDGVLDRVFGRYAARMRERASGIDHRPVISERADVSMSAEETFDSDIRDSGRLRRKLGQLSERVAARLRQKNLQANVVVVKIRTADFQTRTRQRQAQPPVTDADRIAGLGAEILDEWLADHPAAALRLLGLGVSGLTEATQLRLFDEPGLTRSPVDHALDEVQERFGNASLVRGRRLKGSLPDDDGAGSP